MKRSILLMGTTVGLATFTVLPAQVIDMPIRVQVLSGKAVTGAPYSADEVTETTQVLGDGNRIAQSSSMKLYRDSQGRERQEEGSSELTRILISDPVSKASFTLAPQTRTAQKSATLQIDRHLAADIYFDGVRVDPANVGQSGEFHIVTGGAVFSAKTAAGLPTPATEQLSPKTIEGVFANGTRTTVTIPAGQIGNQQPIQVVDEVWYSPDLQMNVMTKHSDPRTGEVVYQLKNISRGEPDASLFQVPPDYKITELGGRGRGGVAR